MKKLFIVIMITMYALGANATSGVVIDKATDNTGGKVGGGIVGFLLGGFAGPIGSLAGGLAGIFIGETTQDVTQHSGNRYLISQSDGKQQWLRSPNYSFAIGDKVNVNGLTLTQMSSINP